MALTDRKVMAARADQGRLALPDGGGLYLRVFSGGAKSWAYRYQSPETGKRVWLDLGRYESAGDGKLALTLAQARAKARELSVLRASGADPKNEARRAAEAVTAARQREAVRLVVVRELFEQWARVSLTHRKDSGASVLRAFNVDVFPSIGDVPVSAIRKAHLMGILDKVVARGSPVQANRLLGMMKSFFGFAIMRELIDADPTARIEKKHAGGKEKERERVLDTDEIRQLAQQFHVCADVRIQHCIWVMLATLARVGELSQARQIDICLKRKEWVIPADSSKNGRAHTVHLSEFAVLHLQALLKLAGLSEWLLPGRSGVGPIDRQTIAKAIANRQSEGVSIRGRHTDDSLALPRGYWTPHDLRRSGATLMGELGIAPSVIERCLNHREASRVVRTYQRQLLVGEQVQAFEVLGERLSALARAP